ncbi:type I restriction enzyme HsdR N-terminal domain-containing protein [Beijerinckia sp. L45]|uniref:type I restriction enzyme HsdR N-terminal domain-containing protein n=1 Tax=Beijerinckia sp. L45 TaxID=1641855 RepID=UPI00131E7BD0|nr:type I restriction enzyme HsdR N-terminal domain-containing protein [Beijerinckia sp. L45]
MASMFSRLYSYRERDSISPLENFLTEALAELFRRLPANLQVSFALALVPPADRRSFSQVFNREVAITLETQVSIPVSNASKRPDLVLYGNGRPLLIIEAKVGAGLQEHEIAGDPNFTDSVRLTQHQLKTYADWIKRENDHAGDWPGAIAFLTAYTVPPADFAEGLYRGAISAVRTWRHIGDWIFREVPIANKSTTYCAFAAELRQFLKERNLMTKYMSSRDLAAAALFAPAASNLEVTFAEVMKAVGRHAEKLKGARQIKTEFWSDGNIFWSWFHFAKSVKRPTSKPYVAVGICFDVAEPWSADVAKLPRDEPFFFVACADDWAVETPARFLTGIPNGWIEMDEDCLIAVARPVAQFAADPDVRVEELKTWAIRHIDELVSRIPNYAVAPLEASKIEADEDKVEV